MDTGGGGEIIRARDGWCYSKLGNQIDKLNVLWSLQTCSYDDLTLHLWPSLPHSILHFIYSTQLQFSAAYSSAPVQRCVQLSSSSALRTAQLQFSAAYSSDSDYGLPAALMPFLLWLQLLVSLLNSYALFSESKCCWHILLHLVYSCMNSSHLYCDFSISDLTLHFDLKLRLRREDFTWLKTSTTGICMPTPMNWDSTNIHFIITSYCSIVNILQLCLLYRGR